MTGWAIVAASIVVLGLLEHGLMLWVLGRRSGASASGVAVARAVEMAAVRDLVDRYGDDSLAPFLLRPDKTFHFAAGAVLAYRVLGRTAVVSADPVGPPEAIPAVIESFLAGARARRLHVVVYGASARYASHYARLGLRATCAGQEAVVDPGRFGLEGRRVRKLRQSVHRVDHRGWRISAFDGIDIDASTEADIDTLEASWRASRSRLLGFAMSMGPYERRVHPDDLYLLARDPEGRLAASMRFITHRGKLSLDTMRRVAQAPNGLNEALICRALEVARQRGIPEVSLNYAGLAHVIRDGADGGRLRRRARTLVIRTLGRHFQMERLVRFNDKFDPEWRNRYLLYEKRRSLPSAVVRVLQAEGYLPARAPVSASATFWQRAPRATIQRRGAAARGR